MTERRGLDFGFSRADPPSGGGVAIETGDTKLVIFGIVGLVLGVAVAVAFIAVAPWLGWSAVILASGCAVRLAAPAVGQMVRYVAESRVLLAQIREIETTRPVELLEGGHDGS